MTLENLHKQGKSLFGQIWRVVTYTDDLLFMYNALKEIGYIDLNQKILERPITNRENGLIKFSNDHLSRFIWKNLVINKEYKNGLYVSQYSVKRGKVNQLRWSVNSMKYNNLIDYETMSTLLSTNTLAVKTTLYKNEAKNILWIDDNKTFLKYAEIMRYDTELI